MIQFSVPGGWAFRNKVGVRAGLAERAPDDLFHAPVMQINAGTKHGGTIEEVGSMTNVKSPETGEIRLVNWRSIGARGFPLRH